MKIRVSSISARRRTNQWATLTVPTEKLPVQTTGSIDWGEHGRAPVVVGPMINKSTALLHVLVPFIGPYETREAELQWSKPVTRPWAPSPWVAYGQVVSIFIAVKTMEGLTGLYLPMADIKVIEANDARRVIHFRGRIPKTQLVVDFFMYVYSGQDPIPFELQITCSDPTTSERIQEVERVSILSLMGLSVRYGSSRGVKPCPPQEGLVTVHLAEDIHFGDAQGLAWTGAILPLPREEHYEEIDRMAAPVHELGRLVHQLGLFVQDPPGFVQDGEVPEADRSIDGEAFAINSIDQVAHRTAFTDCEPVPRVLAAGTVGEFLSRLDSLAAAFDGHLVGMVDAWDGWWGPWGETPKIREAWAPDYIRGTLYPHLQGKMCGHGGPWDDLPIGQARITRFTGDQDGFGVTQAVEAFTLFDPVYLIAAEFCALTSLACRPVHHREADGSLTRSKDHPDWVTWDQETHYDERVSPDRLGKINPEAKHDTNGWSGHDDQHDQPLIHFAHYLLTGSYLGRLQLEALAEKYLAGQTIRPGWSTTHMNTARAVGRTLQDAGWLFHCLDRSDVLARAVARVRQSVAEQWPGGGPGIADEVRILTVYRGDDRGPSGKECLPFWRPVFEAIGVVGLAMVFRLTGDKVAQAIAYQVIRSVVNHGTRTVDGIPQVAWGLVYRDGQDEGQPLAPEQYGQPRFASFGEGAWETWALAGIKLGVGLARSMGDETTAAKCYDLYRAIVKHYKPYPPHYEAALRWPEWGAVPLWETPEAVPETDQTDTK